MKKAEIKLIEGDCLEVLKTLDSGSVDLVFGSPPYENCRSYGIEFNLWGQAWVDWMVAVVQASLRVCRGLVAFVVEGKTKGFRWSATPVLLMADLHRAGVSLRKPPVFHRVGIPGSGGPDWLRNDYEFIVCCQKAPGRLPWSDNTACGHPPKWAPGGEMSHRLSDGTRVNQWGKTIRTAATKTLPGGAVRSGGKPRPSHRVHTKRRRRQGADTMEDQNYFPPVKANPGNVIACQVGGGHMGSKLAHENEAPFPELLAEFFIKSFCPLGGIVLDPFVGSGTTISTAIQNNRRGIGIDVRACQIELSRERIAKEQERFALLEEEGQRIRDHRESHAP